MKLVGSTFQGYKKIEAKIEAKSNLSESFFFILQKVGEIWFLN